jgi:hypothetical protein
MANDAQAVVAHELLSSLRRQRQSKLLPAAGRG